MCPFPSQKPVCRQYFVSPERNPARYRLFCRSSSDPQAIPAVKTARHKLLTGLSAKQSSRRPYKSLPFPAPALPVRRRFLPHRLLLLSCCSFFPPLAGTAAPNSSRYVPLLLQNMKNYTTMSASCQALHYHTAAIALPLFRRRSHYIARILFLSLNFRRRRLSLCRNPIPKGTRYDMDTAEPALRRYQRRLHDVQRNAQFQRLRSRHLARLRHQPAGCAVAVHRASRYVGIILPHSCYSGADDWHL